MSTKQLIVKQRKPRRSSSRASSRASSRLRFKNAPRRASRTRVPSARARAPQQHAKRIRTAISAKSPNNLSSVLAQAICLPSNASNLRLVAKSAEVAATACATVHRETDAAIPGVHGTYEATFPGGSYFFALFRDPLRSSVRLQSNPSALPYGYRAKFYNDGNLTETEYVQKGTNYQLQPVYYQAQSTTSFRPHDDFLFCGADSAEHYYIWVDLGATVTTVVAPASYLGDTLEVVLWSGGNRQPQAPATLSGNSYIFTAVKQGYYSFSLNSSISTTTNEIISCTLTGTGDVMGHKPAPGFLDLIPNVRKYRSNATAVQFTDVAALLNRGGRIHGAWCEGSVDWWNRTLTSDIITNGSIQGVDYETLGAENGVYAYLKPKDDPDLAFRSGIMTNEAKILQDAFWPIDDSSAYLVLRIDVSASGSDSGTVAPGLDFVIREYTCLEFQTPSMIFERHLAETDHKDYINAMCLLRQLPCFYENPTHMQNITRAVRGAYNMVRVHGGGMAALLTKMFPSFAPAALPLAMLSRALPKWN